MAFPFAVRGTHIDADVNLVLVNSRQVHEHPVVLRRLLHVLQCRPMRSNQNMFPSIGIVDSDGALCEIAYQVEWHADSRLGVVGVDEVPSKLRGEHVAASTCAQERVGHRNTNGLFSRRRG